MTKSEVESVITFKHFSDLDEYIFDFDSDPALNNPSLFSEMTEDQMNAKFKNSDAVKKFDYLDFVIIDVDAQILPWMEKAQDLMLLFRMCKAAEKPVITMGIGMG